MTVYRSYKGDHINGGLVALLPYCSQSATETYIAESVPALKGLTNVSLYNYI